jgi:hypothetical protein
LTLKNHRHADMHCDSPFRRPSLLPPRLSARSDQ